MKTISMIVAAVAILALASGAMLAQNGNDLFQQGLVKERTDGDYAGAIKIYQSIVQKFSNDRKLVAKTLYQIGQAYEKLGNAEAKKTYQRITSEFNDQKDIVADASRRLAAMNQPAVVGNGGPRTVFGGDAVDRGSSISPDGRWMAMADWETAGGGLVIRDMSSGQLRLLQMGDCNNPRRNCAFGEMPVFSPDMKWIAYTWYNEEFDGHGQLRIIANEAGAKPRVLARNLEYDGIWPHAWSPDGKSILVATRQHVEKTWQMGWVSVSDGSLKVLRSLDWRIVNNSAKFSISPDGRYVTYAALTKNPQRVLDPASPEAAERHIYVLAADGSSEAEVVKTATTNQFPVWAADGEHIVFTSTLSGKTDLWSVPVGNGKSTGSPSMLQRDLGDILPLGSTRSGAYYYVRFKEGVNEISIAEFGPASQSRIVDTFLGMNPTWSPDGKSLAFSRRTANPEIFDLFVRSSTGEETVYKRNDLRNWPPRWLHNGSGFLQGAQRSVGSVPDFAWQLLDLKTGTFREAIGFGAFRPWAAAVSRDDRTLYIVSRPATEGSDVLVGVDLDTNQQRIVHRLPGQSAARITLALSPAGDQIAVATVRDVRTRDARLVVVRTDGSDYRELPISLKSPNVVGKLAWSKDGSSLLFAENDGSENAESRIVRIPLNAGKAEFTGLTVRGLGTFDLSPEGSRIAFSTTPNNSRTQDLMVIENLTKK